MADRYFVGTGNWDSSDTSVWSDTSGGTTGFSIPTSTDDVFIDANSGTVTIMNTAICHDITFTGFTSTLAGTSNLDVYGSLLLVSGMTLTFSGDVTFKSTSTGETVTTGGKTITFDTIFNGSGGEWTLQDAFSATGSQRFIDLQAGSLVTNNYNVTAGYYIRTSSTVATTITLGSSTISTYNWDVYSPATVNAGTSTITDLGASFLGGGKTYNNVTFNRLRSDGNSVITGANTIANLTITGTASKVLKLYFFANQTITSTFTVTGNSITNRILVATSTIGTPYTISAATTTLSYCDFQDIIGTGGGSWSGTSIGNALGNTGITFTTPVTRYAVASGSWSSTSMWSTSSGGASGASVPLCHDTVVLDASSASGTYSMDMPRAGANITCTGFTRTLTSNISIVYIYGNLTFSSGMTFNNGSDTWVFSGRGSQTLDTTGKSLYSVNMYCSGGSYTLSSNLTCESELECDYGTFTANNYDVHVLDFLCKYAATVNMGSGTWTVTNINTAWSVSSTNTINAGTSTIVIADTGIAPKKFIGGGKTYYNVTIQGAGISSYTFTGSNTFNTLTSTKTVEHGLIFTAGTTTTFANFQVAGTSGNVVTLNSTTTGTFALVKSGGGRVTSDYLNIQHSVATPSNTWYAGVNSIDNQSTTTAGSGWIFNVPLPTVTTQANSGTSDVQSTANGNITDDGNGVLSERGFVYDIESKSLPSNIAPISSGYASVITETGTFSEGAYTGAMSGLTESTTYYVRAYTLNEAGYSYGDEVNFTTSATPLAPTLTTETVTSKTDTTCTGNGTIVSTNTSVTRRGFVISTTPHSNPSNTDPDVSGYEIVFDESGTYSTGTYTLSITGLTTATTYYIRSFGENTAGFGYGDELSFTTVGVAVVTEQNPTNRQSTSVTLNGTITSDGDDTCTVRGFNYGTSVLYGSTTTENGSFNEGAFSSNITGLTQNTTYYYRAYATNAIGTSYSSGGTFSTNTFPSITPIDNIDAPSQSILINTETTTSAIVNGTTSTANLTNL